ncbi:MAG: lysophospholipid acyltransferase family protein [Planctomycetota bacterium]|jgi:lauroyl/myristoyl acyltransferase
MRWLRLSLALLAALPLSLLFCLLPRPWAHRVGRRLGTLAFLVSTRSREVALENLQQRLHLDLEEAQRVARESLRIAGAAVADLLRAPRVSRKLVRRDVELPAATRRVLTAIREGRKGAVLACAHYGNWEFANLVWPFMDMPPTTLLVRPVPHPLADRILVRYRSWTGQRVVHRRGGIAKCVRRVREGELAAITVDLPDAPHAGAQAVDFFGVPTFTTVAAGYVAAVTGAPLYLGYLLPLGRARYRLVLDGPIDAPTGDTHRETALAATRHVTRALEQAIRRYPEAWAWWLKRWRIRPEGARGAYPSYAVDERWLDPDGAPPPVDVAP